jgi:long-chain fatty acid transport protein
MEYDHPESIQTGIRYTDNKKFSVEFDMTWTRWSILEEQIEKVSINFPDGSVMETSFEHDRDWDDAIQYKIGLEYNVLSNIALRCGYTYDPTPIPDTTFEFGWPDTDRSVYNIGCGWAVNENWTVDRLLQNS